jgi:hypothetical protein
MKPANARKKQTLWCDIYPNMERKILFFTASAPPNSVAYPKKRIWLTVEIPGDEELWPEIFNGAEIEVKKIEIEGAY